jgi:hypothetical protein
VWKAPALVVVGLTAFAGIAAAMLGA